MADYDNTNRGSIWKNEKKREGKQDGDFTGNQNVVCPHCGQASEFWVTAWKRKEGAKPNAAALSWSVRAKEQPEQPNRNPTSSGRDDMNDDIPF